MKTLTFSVISIISALVCNCATTKSKSFYVLTPDTRTPSTGGIGVGIGPITVAEYIDRPNLISNINPNEISVSENHRWTGDLSDNITRVMAENLGGRLKTGNVRIHPWSDEDGLRYQVVLDVRQFHGTHDGYATASIGYRIYNLADKSLKASQTFSDREPLEKDGYNALVAAESRLLARLANDIAAQIK